MHESYPPSHREAPIPVGGPSALPSYGGHASAPSPFVLPEDNDDPDTLSPSEFEKPIPRSRRARHLRFLKHLILFLLITAYLIATLVLHKRTNGLPIVIAIYTFISLKLLFYHVSTSIITRPISYIWSNLIARPVHLIPQRIRGIIGILLPIGLLLAFVLLSPESKSGTRSQRLMSMAGLFIFIAFLWATSAHRSAVNWRIVTVGVSLQILLGMFILKTQIGLEIFSWVSNMASTFLEYSKQGAAFVFGDDVARMTIFAVSVLPGVLFFASFIQIVYYLGAMQWLIKKFAWAMVRLMDTSGSESVVAAASPFVGQGESALLVKPFIDHMTDSELHSTMCSGFATIAGSVLIAFISLGIDPQALITACVMSTPCSLAVSKLRYPEVQESKSKGQVNIPPSEDRESNVLHAAANGAAQGVHLVGLICGTILAIISLMALVNGLIGYFGSFLGAPELDLTMIMRYLFVPFAWCIGIPNNEVLEVGGLMAEKMFVNEFAAFMHLSNLKGVLSDRGHLLATFALCGFANFASIGIQIGCIGAMAPSRKGDLARLAVSAMLCGTMSTFMTATIAGMLL
ncbi:MAG: nucleoside transporter [Piptocephalis tieghemiana]|nr:MAG: nucleoside transporter [Piptocephalis tieghemiana]